MDKQLSGAENTAGQPVFPKVGLPGAWLHLADPGNELGYLQSAQALRDGGDPAAAETLLGAGVARFPDSAGLLSEWAGMAVVRRDQAEADMASRFGRLRQDFPDRLFGYVGAARAMRSGGRLAEADALLAETVARFPHDAGPLLDWTELALLRQDLNAARSRVALLRERFPDHPSACILAARTLRSCGDHAAAEALLGDTVARFPSEPGALTDWADIALLRQDMAEARRRCALLRDRFPDHSSGYVLAARALRDSGDTAEAERLLGEAVARFPVEARALVDWANLALRRHDAKEAVRRAGLLQERRPADPLGFVIAAQALHAVGNVAEAETLLQQAILRFPAHPDPAVAYAELASLRQAWPEAAERWQNVFDRFPHHPIDFDAVMHPLRALGRSADIERVLEQRLRLVPDDLAACTEYGWMAHARADWTAAEQRWATVRTRFPDQVLGYTAGALAYRETGRYDDAEALLRRAAERLPLEPSPVADLARVAEVRQDWAEAERRWADFLARFPHHADDGLLSYNLLDVALAGGDRGAADTLLGATPLAQLQKLRARQSGVAPDLAQSATSADDAAATALMLRFESLGHNCEFGLVQRRCKAEPLGLLRFSATPPEELIAALDSRFAGMARAENLAVVVAPNGRDYMVRDRRFGFYYHAWVSVGSMGPEEIHRRETRRLPRLIGKLLEDLEAGEKLFVYHAPDLDSATAARLVAAIRRHGNGTLFWVGLQDAEHPAGTAQAAGPGLIRGYIDRFAPINDAYDFSFDCWMTLCRKAIAIQEGQGPV